MMNILYDLTPEKLLPSINTLFELSGEKINLLQRSWDPGKGTPVFTVQGKYTSRGWTEWTQGFQFGSALLQYDATGDESFLEIGRKATVSYMATHVSHFGVHDHGFNNISTYGNLLRLMREGRIPHNEWEKHFYELALKISGAVQAARWTDIGNDSGYIYSFNGPHSLFADTVRSLRSLAVAHQLGHVLMGEKDSKISLLHRLIRHVQSTAKYNVYFGEGRDAYDIRGRVAHESIFNLNDGSYRCASTQQGYSPFSTWTRGLAWILCGYAEQLEFLITLPDKALEPYGGRGTVTAEFLKTALAVADFYIEQSPRDGIPYWDTGAPGLAKMGNYLDKPADPFNAFEPVDSSAALIAAQGLIRLGNYLSEHGSAEQTKKFRQAGLTVAQHAFSDPYLSTNPQHQGLILHSVYHRPNGWDHVPDGSKVPCGESTMWGDYHARELALLIKRMGEGKAYYTFFLQK
ncbi:MAG: glycoside hydrolase family 88 protein [Ignavibacteriae bacterium]|nr:glycoside hydrolase family 88 protein [Ignavibacteriota bacterium]